MLIRPGTLLLQHFALSWLLSNFESFYTKFRNSSKLSNFLDQYSLNLQNGQRKRFLNSIKDFYIAF